MTEVRLCFDDSTLNHLTGNQAVEFLTKMLRGDPHFFVSAADEIQIKGAFGRHSVEIAKTE